MKQAEKISGCLVPAAVITLLAAGCGTESPTLPRGDRIAPAVRNSTIVIPENDELFLWSRDGSRYIFGYSGEPPAVSCWKTVAGTADGGYMRKVYSASAERRKITAETGYASLTDLLISGVVSVSFGAGPGVAGRGINLSGLVLFGEQGGNGALVRITEGSAGYSPRVDLCIKVLDERVAGLSMRAEGDFRLDLSMEARLPARFECSREILIASFRSERVAYAGRLPIPVSAVLDLFAGIDIEGDSIPLLDLCYSEGGRLAVWCENREGAWSAGGNADTSLSINRFTCASASDGRIKISLRPALRVSVFGEPLFDATFEHWTGLESRAGAPPYWRWKILTGISAGTEFSTRILDEELAPAQMENIRTGRTAFEGPYSNDRYIFTISWGTEGAGGYGFFLPWAVAVTPQGNIAVTDSEAGNVRIFAPDSTLLASWGAPGSGPGELLLPAGAAADGAGNIYVVDRGNYRVQKFSPSGEFAGEWGGYGEDDGHFMEPARIAVAPSGEILVTDGYTNRVQVFSAGGIFLFSWGGYGSGSGLFNGASGIAVSEDGSVFVSECRGNRIQKFSMSGLYLLEWGSRGGCAECFDCPIDLCAGPGGTVAVADYGNNRVQIFTGSGALVSVIGSAGSSLGRFSGPRGVASTSGGTLYVCDSGNHRIQSFEPLK